MPPAASSPTATTRARTSSRTDKRALLDALTAQLKHEKAQAEQWAVKMVEVEDQVTAKHREFLDEEERLSRQRDHNAATIASLRRDLARARRALEEALHVEADEADAYLALLSSAAGARQGAQDGMVTASEGDLEGDSDGDDLEQRRAIAARPPSPPSARTSERTSSGARTRPSFDIVPPRPERPTSHIVGHRLQQQQHGALPPGARSPGAISTSSELALDRSVWRDSLDEQREAGTGGMHPELARHGGRWSRVFPGLVRRRSSTQARA
ncbi:hypothetical protein JCM9279_005203 [Rhodotorula babjevae]